MGRYTTCSRLQCKMADCRELVVEVGVSESHQKLKADAEWRITNSKGDVKLVRIVSPNRETPNIKFETVFLDKLVSSLQHRRASYIPPRRTDYHQPSDGVDSRV